MRFAQPTLAIASSFVSASLIVALLTTPFFATAQSVKPHQAADCCGGTATVLAPASTTATAATLAATPNLSQFNRLVKMDGLTKRLKQTTDAYTVFAPTNAAVAKVPAAIQERMFRSDNPGLRSLVRYHIVKGALTPEQLTDGRVLETLNGQELRVTRQPDGTVLLNGVYPLQGPGRATANGMIYAVETMMAP